jgi:hypothetical protein
MTRGETTLENWLLRRSSQEGFRRRGGRKNKAGRRYLEAGKGGEKR